MARADRTDDAAPGHPARVLFVNHEIEFGGAERSLMALLEAIDRDRYEPHLACSQDGPLAAAAREAGARVHFVPMSFRGRLRKALGLLRAGSELARTCRAERIALLHANTLIAGYCALRAGRASATPVVWHVRDATYPAAARFAVRRASRIIANSRATAASLGPRARAEVIYNGVPRAFFVQPIAQRRAELRTALELQDGVLLAAIVGRIDPQKGHAVLLDAAERLRDAPLAFVVVGDVALASGRARFGDLRGRLEADAKARRLPVRFLGQRDDVAAVLAGCDLLVHPTTGSEAFGRAIAEAQAVGLPVVASRLGGIPEIVADGTHGLLVPPGDAEALATALARLAADPELRARCGTAARANAARHFTAAAHATAVQAVWTRALDYPARTRT